MQSTTAMKGRQLGMLAGAVLLALSLEACGGGSGGGESKSEGTLYPGAVSLVDGRVGDSPFYDDGSANGLADGRSMQASGGQPVTVEWSPLLQQLDGAPEAQLAGFRLYYGNRAGMYDFVIEIGDPAAQNYRLPGLPAGAWYFAVSGVDGANREGPLSRAAVIRLN
jgi:hypothetical protein